MNQHFSHYKKPLFLALFVLLVSVACGVSRIPEVTPTPAPTSTPLPTSTPFPTSTPEPLEIIDGEIDACLLLTPGEIEQIINIPVASEPFTTPGATSCRFYSLIDGKVKLMTAIYTDDTLKKDGSSKTATEYYQAQKNAFLELSYRFKLEELDNFGDQAIYVDGNLTYLDVLKNNILYFFITQPSDNGGIGKEALMELAKAAVPRMP